EIVKNTDVKIDRLTDLVLQLGGASITQSTAAAAPAAAAAPSAGDAPSTGDASALAVPDAHTIMHRSQLLQANTDFSNTLKNTLPVFFNDCIEHKQHPRINWILGGLRRQNKSKCKLVYQGIVNLAAPHEERYEWTNMRNTIVGRLGVLYQRTLASRMLVAKKVLAGQNADEYEPTDAEIKGEIGNKKLLCRGTRKLEGGGPSRGRHGDDPPRRRNRRRRAPAAAMARSESLGRPSRTMRAGRRRRRKVDEGTGVRKYAPGEGINRRRQAALRLGLRSPSPGEITSETPSDSGRTAAAQTPPAPPLGGRTRALPVAQGGFPAVDSRLDTSPRGEAEASP
ncbi:hypothetical protein THAOC_06014, partial [Thalassiosira oceanica]